MKRLSLLFSFLFIVVSVFSQSVYKLSYKLDAPLLSVGVVGNIPPLILKKKKPVLSEETINNLNRNDIWKVDRFATRNWNTKVALASDITMFTSMLLPVVLLANKPARNEAGKITLIYTETLLVNAALTNLTKELVKRKRPYNYNPNAPLSKKQERDATSSFFSGHTSFTASSSFFLAKVYADTNPNSKWKPLVWTGAATLPLTTAILRVAAGKHFPTDVLVGYIVGAATGFLVPHIHKVSTSKTQ